VAAKVLNLINPALKDELHVIHMHEIIEDDK